MDEEPEASVAKPREPGGLFLIEWNDGRLTVVARSGRDDGRSGERGEK
jgi:hypothetical protein